MEAGEAHRPFNPPDDEVVLSSTTPNMPQSFAASLVQLYRVMDKRGTKPATMRLQLSVVDRNYYPEYALHLPAGRGV